MADGRAGFRIDAEEAARGRFGATSAHADRPTANARLSGRRNVRPFERSGAGACARIDTGRVPRLRASDCRSAARRATIRRMSGHVSPHPGEPPGRRAPRSRAAATHGAPCECMNCAPRAKLRRAGAPARLFAHGSCSPIL
ncbi:hypothetical protein NX868_22075 [Burkholderia thailandensis]|nr:hypothetical protein [Burkholderia thailandensis]MCS3394095.1 hypothetical protein [Burkholderia thailandensis]MCS6484952.1 hypothetical protein [Burkholderia thailandensis]MCS6490939.1 hypothetical protein [Burkholderia thailandensis]MCZ2902291.1 hypothetical protein [Burkholderia thailandensis]MDD1482760.1 hypothetical protein [Burkholderia thailandensis]